METKFDPRKLMEMAIDAMRRTVSEPRKDGKASPLVGAVLRKPDGTVETACRGELRHGDHAVGRAENGPKRSDGRGSVFDSFDS